MVLDDAWAGCNAGCNAKQNWLCSTAVKKYFQISPDRDCIFSPCQSAFDALSVVFFEAFFFLAYNKTLPASSPWPDGASAFRYSPATVNPLLNPPGGVSTRDLSWAVSGSPPRPVRRKRFFCGGGRGGGQKKKNKKKKKKKKEKTISLVPLYSKLETTLRNIWFGEGKGAQEPKAQTADGYLEFLV